MSGILAVAPHPDDETLGIGGTLLRHRSRGEPIHWLIVTAMDVERFDAKSRETREREIEEVGRAYGFASVSRLGYPTAQLDKIPSEEIVSSIGSVVATVQPESIYLPFPGDAHTDHRAVFQAAVATTKWFRYPSVRRILAYETLSETNFCLAPDQLSFRPNVFINMSAWLAQKIEIMRLYHGEIGEHPFPRSEQAIRALGALRGSEAGCAAAEAFMLLKEVVE